MKKIYEWIKTKLNIRFVKRSILQKEIAWLDYRLSQANGALSDIIVLVTSCVNKDNKSECDLAKSVLRRILCSSSKRHDKPSWYIHEWEKELYEQYYNRESQRRLS